MACPKLEHGYTKIVNSLLESIYRTNFTSTELKIILFIMRYTYGYNRKEHELSLTFISRGIGISKRYVSSSVNKMINDKVLLVTKEYTDKSSRVIKINKDFDSWLNKTNTIQEKQSSSGEVEYYTTDEVEFNSTDEVEFNSTDEVELNSTDEVENNQENKNLNKINKNNIKKDSICVINNDEFIIDSDIHDNSFEMICVENIIQSCLELYSNSKVPETSEEKKIWSLEIKKMMKFDGRTKEEIAQALSYALNNNFWKSNIRSTKKFREKFDTLYIQSSQVNKSNLINKGQQIQDNFINNVKGWLNDETGVY